MSIAIIKLKNKNMNIKEAIKYFGNQSKLARAAKVERQEVNRWVKRGYIPYKKQIIIEEACNKYLSRDDKEEALEKERYNMHTPKNSIYNDDEDLILELYDNGARITDIQKEFNYGKYHNLRKFIFNRIKIRELKS
jgi:predicted site-specific integrase-resolvase